MMSHMAGLLLMVSWIQLSSDHFTVISNSSQDQVEAVIESLEAFHAIPGLVLFGQAEPEHTPIRVLLLKGKYFDQIVPYSRRDATGFLQPAQDHDILVLSGSEPSRISVHAAYHELTHHFVERNLKQPPLWLSEGLAEYFEDTEFKTGRMILRSSITDRRLPSIELSFSELFKVTKNSLTYRNAKSAEAFYLKSHATVHFLLHSSYKEKFKRYIAALRTGPADLQAFLGVSLSRFGRDFFEHFRTCGESKESHAYDAFTGSASTMDSVSEGDAEAFLAEILMWRGDLAGARRRIEMVDSWERNSAVFANFLKLFSRTEAGSGTQPGQATAP